MELAASFLGRATAAPSSLRISRPNNYKRQYQ